MSKRRDVVSDVAGKVWTVDASVGAVVAEDDPVITLESMKMEIPVPAPCAGTVAEIRVSEGDVVEEGQVVAIMETP